MHFKILVFFAFILHIYLHLCKATNLHRLFTIILYWSKGTFMVYVKKLYIYIQSYTYLPSLLDLLVVSQFKQTPPDLMILVCFLSVSTELLFNSCLRLYGQGRCVIHIPLSAAISRSFFEAITFHLVSRKISLFFHSGKLNHLTY